MYKILFIITMLMSVNVLANESQEILPCGDEEYSKISFVEREAHRYPRHMPQEYVNGRVRLEIKVNSEGKLINIVVINAEPKRLFDRSAKRALKKSVYSKSNNTKDRCGIVEVIYELE